MPDAPHAALAALLDELSRVPPYLTNDEKAHRILAAGWALPEREAGPWKIESFRALKHDQVRQGWWSVVLGGQQTRPERPYALLATEAEAIAVCDTLNNVAASRGGAGGGP